MSEDNIFVILGAAVVALFLFIGVGMIIRNLWLTITNPKVAHLLGRKTRLTIEGASRAAGKVVGATDGITKIVGDSFREGRNPTVDKDGASKGDA